MQHTSFGVCPFLQSDDWLVWGQLLRANTRLEVILELFNRSGDWWQFVGPVWLKPTLTVWNFLLSWFNTGSTCWKMYMQPMTFSLCILPSSPCSRVSSFSRAWGRTNVSVSSKKSSSSSFFTSSGWVYSCWLWPWGDVFQVFFDRISETSSTYRS